MENNFINKINDIKTLINLKNDLLKEDINAKEILEKYINNYNEENEKTYETHSYQVNFGHSRNIIDFKNNIKKMNPCSTPTNYRESTIKAKGEWKDIYEIAFGSTDTTITTKTELKEKPKQRIIKEAS